MSALAGVRVCDLSGQLAGAGATRTLAALGAEVIRVEDPVRQGRWDLLRGIAPFADDRRGIEMGGAFNNHNVGKLGVTINTRLPRGRELLARLIAVSDVVTENFSAGVMEAWGFTYERMRELRPDVIYVSNCGFGHTGPQRGFRTWGPIVQAVCGLTWSVGEADAPSAGFGFSYMDHHGANFMAFAVLAALLHRDRTGEGQWIDMACVEAGASMLGPQVLDATVNGNASRRPGMPASNRSAAPLMAPHGIYPALGDDEWVAIACRDDAAWRALRGVIGAPWCAAADLDTLAGRAAAHDRIDHELARWTCTHDKVGLARMLLAAGVAAAPVARPHERIDADDSTASWGLWPEVEHEHIGRVRVDGLPIHLDGDDWSITAAAPTLGRHNHDVFVGLLGCSEAELGELKAEHVV